jgi:hypothetical protein
MEEQHADYIKRTAIPATFTMLDSEKFAPEVWGPHYWFFLQTIAHTYPLTPNAVTKRKYYDLIQNFPLFIPNPEIGDNFIALLDRYPITPYLDNRDSFIRWIHFIHNRINRILGKEEITLFEALDDYKALYRPKQVKLSERFHLRKEYVIAFFTVLCFIFIILIY